jgi:FKBP-type peptidyl-prolyl cis-trans isomerase
MKRAGLFTIILFLVAIIYSSCKEDVHMDWKHMNERWYATLEDSLKKDTLFHKTSSGLYYKVLGQGNQRHPNLQDRIHVIYKGTLIDGSVFDESNTVLYMSQLTAGWKEALPLMQDNGHYILYIPSKLGYDTATTYTKIPPYSVLKFDVTLVNSFY